MGVGLDAFGCLDEALDLILGKAGFLEASQDAAEESGPDNFLVLCGRT